MQKHKIFFYNLLSLEQQFKEQAVDLSAFDCYRFKNKIWHIKRQLLLESFKESLKNIFFNIIKEELMAYSKNTNIPPNDTFILFQDLEFLFNIHNDSRPVQVRCTQLLNKTWALSLLSKKRNETYKFEMYQKMHRRIRDAYRMFRKELFKNYNI